MEIELRAFVKNLKEIERRLINLKAKKITREHIIDWWYCPKEFKKFKEIHQHKPGSYGLRIRKRISHNKEYYELNCKVLEKRGDHRAFHEYETQLSDYKQAGKILEGIGFKIFCVLDKIRTTYKLGRCLVNLEDIKKSPPVIELEIKAHKKIKQHKKHLGEILRKLGVEKKDEIETSITNLYMKQYAFK